MAAPHRTPDNAARRRVVGAGLAGLAAAFAAAPFLDVGPAAAQTSSSAGPDAGTQAPAAKKAAPAVEPNYGRQKIRIGVQEQDGAYPANVDMGGSVVSITESGPGVSETTTSTCSTDAGTREPDSTRTYCYFGGEASPNPSPDPVNDQQYFYTAGPGDTVTITQTSIGTNATGALVRDTTTKTYDPCTVDDNPTSSPEVYGVCADTPYAIFTDPGIPPTAVDDSATTPLDTPVEINVLANDDTPVGAPVSSLTVTSEPSHGEVHLTQGPDVVRRPAVAPSGPTFSYTPAAGFTGVDRFTYRLTDPNGSATAVVTITVGTTVASTTPAAPSSTAPSTTAAASSTPVAPTSSATTSAPAPLSVSASDSASSLPISLSNTGTPSAELLGIGALLIAGGGAVTVAARRTRRGRHAG